MKKIIRNTYLKSGVTQKYYALANKVRLKYEDLLLHLSPVQFSKFRYRKLFNRKLNLLLPNTYSEKLIWLNLYWKHPLKAECGDKYTMRAYVQKHGYNNILPELFGVYNKSSEIDFAALPQKFVLKCTHGCGFNIICTNKNHFDTARATQLLDTWLKTDYSKNAGELHYAAMTPRIICEEFLEGLSGKQPTDFKFFCFNGKAFCVLVATDRDLEGHTDKYDFYDLNWNKLPYYKSSLNSERLTPKPAALQEMIEIAETLSKPFPFVRMDLYDIHGKAMLGEMTFTPAGCMSPGLTDVAQNTWGSLITLPAPVA